MSMILPERPDPEEVLKRLAPITPEIYSAIEAGALEARNYFGENPIDDGALAAHLLRYKAKKVLDACGLSAEFEREELPHSGLSLIYAGFHLRIRKAVDGGLPPIPGISAPLQDFYRQQLSWFGTYEGPAVSLNLLFLWEVTANFRLTGLSLACPKAGSLTRQSVKVHFHVPVLHPALTFEQKSAADAGEEPPLPYERADEREDEGGAGNARS